MRFLECSEFQPPSYEVVAVPLQHQWSSIECCPDKPRYSKHLTLHNGGAATTPKFTKLIGGKWNFRSLPCVLSFHVPSIQQKVPTAFPASNEEEQDECLQDIVGTNMSFSQGTFESRNFCMVDLCILCIYSISISCRNHLQKIIPLSSAGENLLFIRFGGFGRCGSS